MKRTQRIITTFELLELAGGRGLTRDELLARLAERGQHVEMRQLERDLNDMRTKLDLPIASSDDVTDEQASSGARVVYFINRRAIDRKSLLTSGQAIAWFESAGCGIWGRPIEDGLVVLHHERSASADQVVRSLGARHPNSRVLYLGQQCFIHFFIEVSEHLCFDLEVRIGRITAQSQRPSSTLPNHQIAVGLSGFQTMSRLFGPRGGHVSFLFPQGSCEVIAVDLGGAERPDESRMVSVQAADSHFYDGTPVFYPTPGAERTLITKSGQVGFGGALLFVAIPVSSRDAKIRRVDGAHSESSR